MSSLGGIVLLEWNVMLLVVIHLLVGLTRHLLFTLDLLGTDFGFVRFWCAFCLSEGFLIKKSSANK
jgi:hypothetical protein